ncbi:kinase-like domain-containing protein [Cunninghamella echinulata]|nr:kinase-like domain-containing protein [Cunninghamella echinulata]
MSFFQQVQALFYSYNKPLYQKKVSSEQVDVDSITKTIAEEETLVEQGLPTYIGLERFRLLSCLGDGAFSIVYKALDKTTLQHVAIKVIRKSEMNPTQKSSVLKEVQLMRNIDHESIISLYEFIETKEFYFLILELCEGGELFHQIVHLTYFSEDLSRHCIRQVAEGIRYLHDVKGVIHRDIKPENLLFKPIQFMKRRGPAPILQPEDDEPKIDEGEFIEGYGGGGIGKIKIADFGLSKVIENSNHQAKTPCGTIGYIAPEIASGEYYTKSVDMWALGCVLYTMLCGFPPFYDDDVDILTEKVAKGDYAFLSPWWDYVSEEAKDLVSHLLCVDPKQRYDIHQFLSHPWIIKQTSPTNEEPCKIIGDILLPSTTTTSVAKENIAAPKPQYIPLHKGNKNIHRVASATNVSSMKGTFDISYDLLRQSEERAYRKEKIKQQHGFLFGYFSSNDTEVEEEDDDEEEYDDDEFSDITSRYDTMPTNSPNSKLQLGHLSVSFNTHLNLNDVTTTLPTPSSSYSHSSSAVLQQQQKPELASNSNRIALGLSNLNKLDHSIHQSTTNMTPITPPPFDLKMDDSTLLGRRKQSTNLKTILPLVRS